MVTQVELKGKMNFRLILKRKCYGLFIIKDFTPLGFSGKGRAEGGLVFAGYGISAPEQNYDDFKDKTEMKLI